MLNVKNLCYFESAERDCKLRVSKGAEGILPPGHFENVEVLNSNNPYNKSVRKQTKTGRTYFCPGFWCVEKK